jgi:hypothetical protein
MRNPFSSLPLLSYTICALGLAVALTLPPPPGLFSYLRLCWVAPFLGLILVGLLVRSRRRASWAVVIGSLLSAGWGMFIWVSIGGQALLVSDPYNDPSMIPFFLAVYVSPLLLGTLCVVTAIVAGALWFLEGNRSAD